MLIAKRFNAATNLFPNRESSSEQPKLAVQGPFRLLLVLGGPPFRVCQVSNRGQQALAPRQNLAPRAGGRARAAGGALSRALLDGRSSDSNFRTVALCYISQAG